MSTFLMVLSVIALGQNAPKPAPLAPSHGVRNIGLLLEKDLTIDVGEGSYDDLGHLLKGRVLTLVEAKDGKTSGVRLISLRPTKLGTDRAFEVLVRDFTGLDGAPEKKAEIFKQAGAAVPYDSETELQKNQAAGKVFELHRSDDDSAPERCYSAPRGMFSMKDAYGRDFAGSWNQCYRWNRSIEYAYNVRCNLSWNPDERISTYGCHCIVQ
ncbi:MAG: hypothetical protein HYZ71_05860 [Deltaproteobacteria bacterium]|nr:hypothetical protein [Deltaproteobacteria bacterium]